MAIPLKRPSAAESLATISHVVLTAFIFAALFIGREILVPLALAALLSFMLGPLATRLERWLGRIGAILVIVALMFAATGATGWVVGRQVVDLANKLPDYKENIRTKIRAVQIPSDGPFNRLSQTFEELKKEIQGSTTDGASRVPPEARAEPAPSKPLPVEIAGPDKRLELVQVILAPLGTAAMVLLLLIFMLIGRDDLRNRIIRLVGQGRISATTRAMDDAAARVSRYLLMLLVVNVTYGIPVAIGLTFIGVPNAILWGALATVLRFIPYVGPWIAASFPILLSLAVSPDWMVPLMTISLFIILELISNNVMEPWLYGTSTGVTPIALIVAALVWTWLWGPVGLVLSTPLTVCLVVMGRHIPRLAFLSIALSDEQPLTPAEDLYQRLHRTGEHDEMGLVDNFLKENSMSALFDSVLIPVVAAAETDHQLGLIETEQLEFVERNLVEVLENLEMRHESTAPPLHENARRIGVLPVKAYRDELAGTMLMQLLRQDGHDAQLASSKLVPGELVNWVRDQDVEIVYLSTVTPTTVTHTRYLCARLRKSLPTLKIIVGMWEFADLSSETLSSLRESGADEIVTTVAEASEHISDYLPPPDDTRSAAPDATLMPCAV